MTLSIFKLFRWKPVAAWGVVGILIAVSCAVSSGLAVDWLNLLIVAGIVLLIQGIIAHGINDLADEAVDCIAPIEATGRSKLLVSGEMTRSCMTVIVSSAAVLSLLLLILLMIRVDYGVLFFAGVAVYAAFGYSQKPLRLGWRPFSELTVVVPVIAALICGVEYVMVGAVTFTAICIGISYGFFNASWFMYSRAQDYEADLEMGKVTTIGRCGLDSTHLFAVIYLTIACIIVAITMPVCQNWYTAALVAVSVICPAWVFAMEIRWTDRCYCRLTPEVGARLRVLGMQQAVVFGACASLAIIVFGGIL